MYIFFYRLFLKTKVGGYLFCTFSSELRLQPLARTGFNIQIFLHNIMLLVHYMLRSTNMFYRKYNSQVYYNNALGQRVQRLA